MPLFPALFAAVFFSTLAMRMTDPLVPILAGEFNVSPGDIALFATAYALPYGVCQLILGPLGDRFGKTTVIKCALFAMGLAIVLSSLATSYRMMVLTRVLAGCFAGGIIPLSLASISDRVVIERRQFMLARTLLAAISGQIMGVFVTGVLATMLPWRGIFGVYAAACFIIVAMMMFAPSIPRNPDSSATFGGAIGRSLQIIRSPSARPLLLTVLAEGLLFYGFVGQIPAYLAQARGDTSAEIGAVIAGYGLGGALYAALLPHMLRFTDGYGIMRMSGVIGGGAMILSTFALNSLAYGALMTLLGYAFYSIHVGMQTRASELDPTARGASISVASATLFMGNGVGPWVLGLSISQVGYSATFGSAAALVVALGLVASIAFRRLDGAAANA